jgi:ubiquinone/menaquinone biosynthesis C-methylase UbiE
VDAVAAYRKEALAEAREAILEIGFGTGLNLPYYPAHVQKISTVDVNNGMNKLAQRNIARSSIIVDYNVLDARRLPFTDASFDTVVSTWTLCSIKNIDEALDEIYRVMKPRGRFIFIEQGLSDNPKVQRWQNRLTPVQKIIADGCHLNRNIEELLKDAGFRFERLKKEYAPGVPRIAGYLYHGVATRN